MEQKKYYLLIILMIICINIFVIPITLSYAQDYDKEIVIKAQKILSASGYNHGQSDGILGKKTAKALKEYQKHNGLGVTGKLDKLTLEKMGIDANEIRPSFDSTLKKIKDELDYTWDTKEVKIENRKLIIVLKFNRVNKKGYLSLLPWVCQKVCKYPNILNQIGEIRILNSNERQGWVYFEVGKCEWIINSRSNQIDNYIISKSKEYDPNEERKKQIAKNADIVLRSRPRILNSSDVRKMLIKYNFFSKCDKWNKGACNEKGNYNGKLVDNGNETITDQVTGLVWQKTGSNYTMNGVDAQSYINSLNRENFLGYNDWRLPTIEELASIIKPKKSSKDMYISPLFSSEQDYCWSSDKQSSDVLWCVYFKGGFVMTSSHKTWQYKVRAVR